jgi:hypothetical protein
MPDSTAQAAALSPANRRPRHHSRARPPLPRIHDKANRGAISFEEFSKVRGRNGHAVSAGIIAPTSHRPARLQASGAVLYDLVIQRVGQFALCMSFNVSSVLNSPFGTVFQFIDLSYTPAIWTSSTSS